MITEYNKYFYLEFQKKLDYLLKKHSSVELEIMELVKKITGWDFLPHAVEEFNHHDSS